MKFPCLKYVCIHRFLSKFDKSLIFIDCRNYKHKLKTHSKIITGIMQTYSLIIIKKPIHLHEIIVERNRCKCCHILVLYETHISGVCISSFGLHRFSTGRHILVGLHP